MFFLFCISTKPAQKRTLPNSAFFLPFSSVFIQVYSLLYIRKCMLLLMFRLNSLNVINKPKLYEEHKFIMCCKQISTEMTPDFNLDYGHSQKEHKRPNNQKSIHLLCWISHIFHSKGLSHCLHMHTFTHFCNSLLVESNMTWTVAIFFFHPRIDMYE